MRGTAVAPFSPAHVPLLPFSGFLGAPPTPRSRKAKVARRGVVTALIELKPLPYRMDSLEPHVSRHTMEYHWGRHQKDHVDSLNKHIEGTKLDTMSLEEIIIKLYRKGSPRPAFSHAAQVWNHDFFWQSMRPGGGGPPSGDLLRLVERDFGSFEFLLKELKRVASTQFGSGWAWLTYKANRLDVGNAVNPYPSDEDYKLVVAKTPNAVNPLVWDYDPLLGIDLWEHAYYLDYENRRDDYISTVLEKLVSWEVVSSRLEMAVARAIKKAEVEETKRQLKEFIVDSGLRARPISIDDADGSRQRRDRSVKVSKDADKPGVADDLDDVDNSGDEDSDDADTLKNKKDSEDADDLDNEDLDDADARKKNEKDSEDEDLDDEDLDDADTLTNENGIVS